MVEIENVLEVPEDTRKPLSITIWENLQLVGLALTIAGQIVIGGSYLFGQVFWLIANLIAVIRDFILKRPVADKIKNICLTGITCGLIIAYYLGVFS